MVAFADPACTAALWGAADFGSGIGRGAFRLYRVLSKRALRGSMRLLGISAFFRTPRGSRRSAAVSADPYISFVIDRNPVV